MIVSTKGRYALRLMAELAVQDGVCPLKQIAEEQRIPYKYAENIATLLTKAELITSSRGKAGGYCLCRPPEQYPLSEILTAVETTLAATGCAEAECPRSATCPTLPVWKKLDETVRNFLSQYTLADLLPQKTVE